MNKALPKLLTTLILLIASIDVLLIAGELVKDSPKTEADSPILLEDVFSLPKAFEKEVIKERIVPFVSQAPLGDWKSPWSDYAEEATVYMAGKWLKDEPVESKSQASKDLLNIGQWEAENFGHSIQTNLEQTLQILTDYFKIDSAYISYDVSPSGILSLLNGNNIIIVPVNGNMLENPYYGDAASHHMILILGFDPESTEFIVHDPGTKYGESYRYAQEKVLNAIQDLNGERRVIIISS